MLHSAGLPDPTVHWLRSSAHATGASACAAQVSPDVQAQHAEALDRAIAGLRYGSINVNVATMLGFCVPKLTWGAYPGNTPQVLPPTPAACLLGSSFELSRQARFAHTFVIARTFLALYNLCYIAASTRACVVVASKMGLFC